MAGYEDHCIHTLWQAMRIIVYWHWRYTRPWRRGTPITQLYVMPMVLSWTKPHSSSTKLPAGSVNTEIIDITNS